MLFIKILLVCSVVFFQSCEKEKDYSCNCKESSQGYGSGALTEMMFGKKKDVEKRCNEYLNQGFDECWVE